jgi:hypothetical protein
VEEGYGQRFVIQHVGYENVVEMSRRKDFGTVGATIEEMLEHTTEQTRSIYQDETVSIAIYRSPKSHMERVRA